MEVDSSHAIFEVEVPKEWIGKTVGELDIRKKYRINIIAGNTMPPPDRVREGNQNRALRAVVARDGRATNMRRELRENFMLLGLLICAIAASFCWIVRLLEQQ